jgi:hypothetical protein
MTDFPPPQDFAGYESRPYDEDDPDERYVRACTPQEIAILEADAAAARAAIRAEDEELRDAWFEVLRGEGNDRHPGLELGSACLPEPEDKANAGSSPA